MNQQLLKKCKQTNDISMRGVLTTHSPFFGLVVLKCAGAQLIFVLIFTFMRQKIRQRGNFVILFLVFLVYVFRDSIILEEKPLKNHYING